MLTCDDSCSGLDRGGAGNTPPPLESLAYSINYFILKIHYVQVTPISGSAMKQSWYQKRAGLNNYNNLFKNNYCIKHMCELGIYQYSTHFLIPMVQKPRCVLNDIYVIKFSMCSH